MRQGKTSPSNHDPLGRVPQAAPRRNSKVVVVVVVAHLVNNVLLDSSSRSVGKEDMCLGVDVALRTCQGAAVNRVRRPGEEHLSPALTPGVATSQLPGPRLPLVFQARTVEPIIINAKSHPQPQLSRSSPSSSDTSQGGVTLVGKVVITLETAATLQRVEEGS